MFHSSGDLIADRRADYAAGLAADGDFAAAADLLRQALELAPGWAAGWRTLGDYLAKAGVRDGAVAAFREAARLDPGDALASRARLAAMGEDILPETLPSIFVRNLFDQYADRFDAHLQGKLAYRAPHHLLEAIDAAAGEGVRFETALDLGCGTGLMGERLRPLAGRLAGLDLSPAMLAKAHAKKLYDELHEADLLAFEPRDASFDLICAADVLNYVGDLAPVFAGVKRWLKPNGLFAFTIEAHDGEAPYVLRETLRYAHSGSAVARLITAAELEIVSQAAVVLRQDRGAPVSGRAFVAMARGG